MISKLLIANRGEIAIRIARAAADLGLQTVSVYPEDDALSLHTQVTNHSKLLKGKGAAAYMDSLQLINIALEQGCDAVHPGYGFLSEQPAFAQLCQDYGLRFIGPAVNTLAQLGNKADARKLARRCNVPLVPGTDGDTSLDEAKAFMSTLEPDQPALLKAIAGGGGRGMRIVRDKVALETQFQHCAAEALAAFGSGDLYIESLLQDIRHIEVQILGDGKHITHLWDRECSLQRRHQKVVEIAPSPSLDTELRGAIINAATKMAKSVKLDSLCTFEFLVDDQRGQFFFIEANPRLQVEHTITEAIAGIDIVRSQIQLANGASLGELRLLQSDIPPPNGYAIQLRINAETMQLDGSPRATSGTLTLLEFPGGPGIRIDKSTYTGYQINPRYDSLLAKIIIHGPNLTYPELVRLAERILKQSRIIGVNTNIEFLTNLLSHPSVIKNHIHTRFIDQHLEQLVNQVSSDASNQFFPATNTDSKLRHGVEERIAEGVIQVLASMSGIIIEIAVNEGQEVQQGQTLAMIDSMKMHHVISSPIGGIVRHIHLSLDSNVAPDQALFDLEETSRSKNDLIEPERLDPDLIRPDLAEVLSRFAQCQDVSRPDAIQRRHAKGKRTARENLADLCDANSLTEYGALTYAAQRGRFSEQELAASTPSDGLVTGIANVNGALFGAQRSRCVVMAYDQTVLAGTQGFMSHKKLARILTVAAEQQLAVIIYAEGGGGRPGDNDDATRATGLNMSSFLQFSALSGVAPRIAVVSGRCFAGNAVIAGCSDFIIATHDSNIGIAGPAMVEGAGLGTFTAEELGPSQVQTKNGVIDCLAMDEADATIIAKKLLSYFQGNLNDWHCVDQRPLRHSVPENRLRSYDMLSVVETLADTGSMSQLRQHFAPNMITVLIRIEGRPVGVLANNPKNLGGAIDANAADKAARFMQLCDAFSLPIVSLCDTPGFMVGPDSERAAHVRHASRMFTVAANIRTPLFSLVLRKGYGLGAMAMTGGSFHAPLAIASWPTGEFGGMGFEGAVKLAYREELANIADPEAKKHLFETLVEQLYQRGKASNVAASLELDAVIDPALSRQWLVHCLMSVTTTEKTSARRSYIDTW
tara:strand:- start:21756 stop:25046 length:3291 start_codon:yes stop_codon:yes gene_type:complete